MDAPVVSVVLPVYNARRYLGEAAESILAQTFSNFELIAIDDGCTDGTLGVLKKLAERDPRVVLVSRENRGLARTLNEGIGMARGKWIARMDADDVARPHRIERQLQWLEQTGADICGSWTRLFGTAERRVIRHPRSDAAIRAEMLFGAPFAHPTVVMRAALAKQLPYDSNWDTCEDYDLWERAARAGWRMSNVPEVLLSYRQHPGQISADATARQLQLTQRVRRRYWEYVFDAMSLKKKWIDEVLRLHEPGSPPPDMNTVDAAIRALLQRTEGEARSTVFAYATGLYFRAAAMCPDVVSRWQRLNRDYGTGPARGTKATLWLLRALRIHSDSRLFQRLKVLHFELGSRR